MTVQKKRIKKLIISSVRENNKHFKEKRLRKFINKQLEDENETKVSKEDFNEIILKLVAKGKLAKDGEVFYVADNDSNEHILDTNINHKETWELNNDFQADERDVINNANKHHHQQQHPDHNKSQDVSNNVFTTNPSLSITDDEKNVDNTNTILLFYEYCKPIMTRGEQDAAIAHCYSILNSNGVTGRLRVGREVYCSITKS